MNNLTTIIVALFVIGYVLFNMLTERPITQRDLFVPVIGGSLLGYSYLQLANLFSGLLTIGSAFVGIVLGLIIAQLVRVWRDDATGLVHQKGNWLFVGAYVGLIALRFVIDFALHLQGIPALNDAMFAMAIGTYIGRTLNISLRSLALNRWNYNALPRGGRLHTP